MHFSLKSRYFLFILATILISNCSESPKKISNENYRDQINQWHQKRDSTLRTDDGWLTLAGLYELSDNTKYSVGSDSSNNIIFPSGAAGHIGTLSREDTTFRFTADPKTKTTLNGNIVDDVRLRTDAEGKASILRQGSFFWYIIERRGDYYVRLKNSAHPNLNSFSGVPNFPISRDWNVKATFERFEEPKTISIPDVLGKTYQDSLYGTLEFSVDGTEYHLAPLGNPDSNEDFFIILGDQTNGETTYSGGRYLYVSTPNEDGITYLDFNKAYNPPCVFTKFATCPLPPAQNRLDVKILAGEKMYASTEG